MTSAPPPARVRSLLRAPGLRSPWTLPLAAIVLGTLLRIAQLFHTLDEMHSFRQTQTALLARNYALTGIDLLHSPLTVFGGSSDVPMEFPLVQAAGALLIRLGIDSTVAMRLLGLLSFQATAVVLTALLLRWHGRRIALIAVVLFEFAPFGLAWGAASLIEFSAVALSLLMVLGIDLWISGGRWWWLAIGSVAGWAAFLVKVTTAPVWSVLVLGAMVALITRIGWRRAWRRVVVAGIAGPGVGLGLALVWTRFADSVKVKNPLTEFLTSSALTDWNFGTLAQHLDPHVYLLIASRVANEMAGPLGLTLLIGVVAAAIAPTAADRIRRLAWAVAAASGPLVFLNLYWVHNYYLSAVYAAVVVVVAFSIDGIARLISRLISERRMPDRRFVIPAAAVVLTLVVLATTALSGLGRIDVRQWAVGSPHPPAVAGIDSTTRPQDRLVMVGCDWDPTLAYDSNRQVVMFRSTDPTSEGFWTRESPASYRYLYICSSVADPDRYLPPGTTTQATAVPGLSRIVPASTDGTK